MATQHIIDRLTATLHAYNLSWLLPSLRQDFVIWSGLNDQAFFEQLVLSQPQEHAYLPADFSPARLAFVALGQCNPGQIDPQHLFEAVDNQILQLAIRNFPGQLSSQNTSQDLAQAGMIALALAYKFHITRSWADLIGGLSEYDTQDWMAPLACLYGMVDTPTELIKALVQPGASIGRFRLAIHCLLTNPLTTDEQLTSLKDLCKGPYGDLLPAADRLRLVHEVSEQCPRLAEIFCSEWLASQPRFNIELLTVQSDINACLSLLAEVQFQVRLRQIAGQKQDLAKLLSVENSLLHSVYTGTASQVLAGPYQGEASTQVLEIAIKAANFNGLSDRSPGTRAELALTLLERGLDEDAAKLLPRLDEPLPGDLATLFAVIRASRQAGNDRYSSAMTRLLELLNQEGTLDSLPVSGEHVSLTSLGKLLLEQHRPLEAARVCEAAVGICPNDARILHQLAACYRATHQNHAAAETLRVLVCLNPDAMDFRRDFASTLEAIEEWEASLEHRSIILASAEEDKTEQPVEDLYGYAYCALKARHPELTQHVCTDLLTKNPEDSQALIYLGEAYLLLGQKEQGLVCLTSATEVTPTNAAAWLALAEAQKETQQIKSVIETLRNAAQAVPSSAQVHFMLGSLYLDDEAPSLALPELRFAAELAPEEAHILVGFAQALRELGHLEDACTALAKAYALDQNLPNLAQSYATMLLELKRYEEALSPLELLIDNKAVEDPATYLDYARCVLFLHNSGVKTYPPMKALIALNQALQQNPGLAEARALTAEVLAASGENELAFQAYREALDTPLTEDRQWFERLSYGFGCIASTIGKHDIAIAALQEASQVNPENPATCKALSDAYLLANLVEDAVRSARNVLVIDGENPDHLAWFAGQMAKILWGKRGVQASASNSLYKEIPSEVLIALHKAIELAPTRTDLLIQLGNFQAKMGNRDEARDTFASLAQLDFATIEDLQNAATFLSQINEHGLATTCLEKGMAIDQASTGRHISSVYTSLAHEYMEIDDQPSALRTLDQAISLLPAENSIVSLKIDILLGLERTQEALDCIDAALPQTTDYVFALDLLFTAMRIQRTTGNLAGVAGYARKAMAQSRAGDLTRWPVKILTQLAELYRSLLQPQQAYLILNNGSYPDPSLSADSQAYLDYLCLYTELALETGEPLKRDIQDAQVRTDDPQLVRLMALQARLINKAGNSKQAARLLQSAVDKANDSTIRISDGGWERPYFQHMNLVALSEAAVEIGLWEISIEISQQACQTSSDPLPLLNLARTIVLRAEYDQLCDTLEVTSHKPSEYARTSENFTLARQYLDQAQDLIDGFREEPIVPDYPLTSDQIFRWQARADIIFNLETEPQLEPEEILARQGSAEDTAALINHLHTGGSAHPDSEALTRIIKLARAFPRQPGVILQIALALEYSNPADAAKSLQSVLAQNPFLKTPTTAFCNYLLARIANSQADSATACAAIETAIGFWNDEPCWHALAAQVYQGHSDIAHAAEHWQVAARLAPQDIAYPMELAKLLLDNAAEDTHLIHQSCHYFESALALQPDEVDALLGLAEGQYLLSDLENADRNARKALTLAPELGRSYQLLGEISIRRNDFQGAYEYANKAMVASPRDVRSTIVLARSLSALGRHNEALSRLNAAIPTTIEPELLELERVAILSRMEGPRAALNELQALADAHPGKFNILSALAQMYLEAGEAENAVTSAQHALSTSTEQASRNEQANLHLLIGQILRKAGQLDQAIQHLSKAIQLAPDRLEPYLELGLARKERREYQQALQVFEQATQIAPEDPRALFQAGLALKESKDYKSSESMLRRAVSLAPNDLNIRRQLAAVVALNLVHNPRLGRN